MFPSHHKIGKSKIKVSEILVLIPMWKENKISYTGLVWFTFLKFEARK